MDGGAPRNPTLRRCWHWMNPDGKRAPSFVGTAAGKFLRPQCMVQHRDAYESLDSVGLKRGERHAVGR